MSYNINNPTKEILASSGIYDGLVYANPVYAIDIPNSTIANTGIQKTTTTTTTKDPVSSSLSNFSNLSSGNYFIDDMLVFNNYIHYDTKSSIKIFNPQSFLKQSIVDFNIYSLEYRQ